MKILLFSGSPRSGNSERIVKVLSKILLEKGADTEVVLLKEKNIPQCSGCVEFCQRTKKCRKESDMQEIIEKMKQSDAFVFVSPSYFGMPSGLFKNFIDMTYVLYPFYFSDNIKGKKALIIGVSGGDKSEPLLTNLRYYCKVLGLEVVGELYLARDSTLPFVDITTIDDNLNKLKELAEKLNTNCKLQTAYCELTS